MKCQTIASWNRIFLINWRDLIQGHGQKKHEELSKVNSSCVRGFWTNDSDSIPDLVCYQRRLVYRQYKSLLFSRWPCGNIACVYKWKELFQERAQKQGVQAGSARLAGEITAEHNSKKGLSFLLYPKMKLDQWWELTTVSKSHFLEDSKSTRLPDLWWYRKEEISEEMNSKLLNLTIKIHAILTDTLSW